MAVWLILYLSDISYSYLQFCFDNSMHLEVRNDSFKLVLKDSVFLCQLGPWTNSGQWCAWEILLKGFKERLSSLFGRINRILFFPLIFWTFLFWPLYPEDVEPVAPAWFPYDLADSEKAKESQGSLSIPCLTQP